MTDSEIASAVVPRPPLSHEPPALRRLRRDYFAQAGEAALRYDVTLDRLVKHLRALRRREPGRPRIRRVRYVEDLVLAVGCLDGHPRAWADLPTIYETSIAGLVSLHEETIPALLGVRRLFASLRQEIEEAGVAEVSTLSRFAGDRSLRTWLYEEYLRRRRAGDPQRDPVPVDLEPTGTGGPG